MTRDRAIQLVRQTSSAVVADLVAPAIAIRPRVIHAVPEKPKRARWWSKLFAPVAVSPTLELAPVFDEMTLPIGASRFDSVPDVPVGFEWPFDRDDKPMECLAQIDLAAAAREADSLLPADGWLLFFVGSDESMAEPGGHRVIYLPSGPLMRWSTAAPRTHVRRPCRIDLEPIWTLPDSHDWCVEQKLASQKLDGDDYMRIQDKLADGARHYLLGYPRAVQNDVRAEAAYARAETRRTPIHWNDASRAGDDWSLLLQLDSDDADGGPGWMWGDVGTLYFVMRKDHLAASRFDRSELVVQCS